MADNEQAAAAAVEGGGAGKGGPRGQQVVEILRSKIVAGHYEPGERLIEAALSIELGTSRGPVREALRQLESEGLVMSFPYRGAVVLGVSPDDWLSHAEFRDRHGLTVTLLSDPECEVCRQYDVVRIAAEPLAGRPHVLRSTFIIDRLGKVRHALYGVSPKGHASAVLDLVKTLAH